MTDRLTLSLLRPKKKKRFKTKLLNLKGAKKGSSPRESRRNIILLPTG